jgi:hypothetical protein
MCVVDEQLVEMAGDVIEPAIRRRGVETEHYGIIE